MTFNKATYVLLEACEAFQKTGFRNRCQVLSAQGVLTLSVPVLGGRENRQPVREVRIDYRQPWQRQQWRTLTSCYNKSAYFYHYAPALESAWFEKHETLWEWNEHMRQWVVHQLGMETRFEPTVEFALPAPAGVADWRNRMRPGNRLNFACEPYPQVFGETFEPNLSILDLLFNLGPQAVGYLQRQTDAVR